MNFEVIENNGIRYAELIWADSRVDTSRFFSPPELSFQFGLLAHSAGFLEPAHFHYSDKREINDLQQMLVVQRGLIGVQFFDEAGVMFREVTIGVGDAICLIHGTHAIRVIEDMQCISVKQGPFFGADRDKIEIEVK